MECDKRVKLTIESNLCLILLSILQMESVMLSISIMRCVFAADEAGSGSR